MECSHSLALKLNVKKDIFSKGVGVQHVEHGLGIHVDKQNDSTPGYNWSAVVAITRNGSRLTINGYPRKCAKDYMNRLGEANHTMKNSKTR